ncbi:MAG: nucleotidyltransferase domain-containing protein [bacterium]
MYDKLRSLALIKMLVDPECSAREFSADQWSVCIRQARRTNLLSRLAYLLDQRDLISQAPDRAQHHFNSALAIAESSFRSTLWEVRKIREAMAEPEIPFVLLKGAAYAVAAAAPSGGRIFSDIDIMVPHDKLQKTERALMRNGWLPTKMDAYDQKYYRRWMHELPPMQHMQRKTSIDVHHTILPPTARLKPNTRLLWQNAMELEDKPGVFILSMEEMVLHSAAHLFHDGDFEQGLRDIVDIDSLISRWSRGGGSWDSLLDLANSHDLSRPLHYALITTKTVLSTDIPDEMIARTRVSSRVSPVTVMVMGWLLGKAMTPSLAPRKTFAASFAMWILFVRSHYLRMPLRLLIPHLVRKYFSTKN